MNFRCCYLIIQPIWPRIISLCCAAGTWGIHPYQMSGLVFGLMFTWVVNATEHESDRDSLLFKLAPSMFEIPPTLMNTEIVGLRIVGPDIRDMLLVSDFDVLNIEGQRFIPLLRLFKILSAQRKSDLSLFQFSIIVGQPHNFEVRGNQLIVLSNNNLAFEIRAGVSDVTDEGELYVAERVFADLFELKYQWDENEYSYEITMDKNSHLFKREKQGSLVDLANIQHLLDQLPKTESTKYPSSSRKRLSFVNTSIRVENRMTNNDFSSIVRPNVTFYGNVFGGNYTLKLSERIDLIDKTIPLPQFWIDKGLWTAKSDYINLHVGDTTLGLDQLIAPVASFSGFVARGFVGNGDKQSREGFLENKRFNFTSETVFTGYEQLGSTVELLVNNRLVDTQIIEDIADAPPGHGRYFFSSVGLLNKSSNEVKIKITRPDGNVIEKIDTVLGTRNLLSKETGAYSIGVGTKRKETAQRIEAEGIYAGLGYYYGLSSFATIGMLAAVQDDFFNRSSTIENGNTNKLPRYVFLGEKLTLKLLDNLQVTAGIATNYRVDSTAKPKAKDMTINYGLGNSHISSYVFSYDKGYTNGSSEIGDRKGYTLSFSWRNDNNDFSLVNSLARLSTLSKIRSEQYVTSEVRLPMFSLFKTKASFRFDQAERNNNRQRKNQIYRLFSASFAGNLLSNFRYKAEYAWGDREVVSTSGGRLVDGLSIPLQGTNIRFGMSLEGQLSLKDYGRLGVRYYDSRLNTRNLGLTYFLMPRKQYQTDISASYRYDLIQKTGTTKLDFEYALDQRRENALGAGFGLDDNGNWSVNLSVTAHGLWHHAERRMRLLSKQTRVNPVTGGIKGQVYFDINGNGHFEPGEPSMPNIDVLVNGAKRVKSDENGYFFVARNSFEDQVVLSLNLDTLPAIFTPTQGIQYAKWDEYVFTNVYLGIAALGSVSGKVTTYLVGAPVRALPGAIMVLTKEDDEAFRKQSISDSEGYYYFGELRPSEYIVDIDPVSYPGIYNPIAEKLHVEVRESMEPDDIENININLEAN